MSSKLTLVPGLCTPSLTCGRHLQLSSSSSSDKSWPHAKILLSHVPHAAHPKPTNPPGTMHPRLTLLQRITSSGTIPRTTYIITYDNSSGFPPSGCQNTTLINLKALSRLLWRECEKYHGWTAIYYIILYMKCNSRSVTLYIFSGFLDFNRSV